MKERLRSRPLALAALAVIGVVATAGLAFAATNGTGHPSDMAGCDHPGKGDGDHAAFGDLTDEQRDELRDTAISMREGGATRDEVMDAVKEKLESFGVDTSALQGHAGDGRGCGDHDSGGDSA